MLRREFLKAVGLALALPRLPQEKVLCLNGVPMEETPSKFKFHSRSAFIKDGTLYINENYIVVADVTTITVRGIVT